MMKSYGNEYTVHDMKTLDLTVFHGNDSRVCVDCGRTLIQGLPVYRHRDAQNPHRRFYCVSCVENPREVPYQSVPRRIVAPEVNIEPEPIVHPEVIQNLDPTIYVEPEPEPVIDDHPVVVPEVNLDIHRVELMDRHRDKLIAVHNGASFRKEFGVRRGRLLKKKGIIRSFEDPGKGWSIELTELALKYLGIDYPAAPRPGRGTLPSRYKFERACDHDREELIVLHSGAALSCLTPGRRTKLRQLNIIGPSERLGANWTAKLTDEAIEYLGLQPVLETTEFHEATIPSEETAPELEEDAFNPFGITVSPRIYEQLLEKPLVKEYLELMDQKGLKFPVDSKNQKHRLEALEGLVVYLACIMHDRFVGVEYFGAEPAPEKPLPKELIV